MPNHLRSIRLQSRSSRGNVERQNGMKNSLIGESKLPFNRVSVSTKGPSKGQRGFRAIPRSRSPEMFRISCLGLLLELLITLWRALRHRGSIVRATEHGREERGEKRGEKGREREEDEARGEAGLNLEAESE